MTDHRESRTWADPPPAAGRLSSRNIPAPDRRAFVAGLLCNVILSLASLLAVAALITMIVLPLMLSLPRSVQAGDITASFPLLLPQHR